MNLNFFSFILASCLSSICVQPALANWPVVSIEKGGTAVVPCVPKGDETAYFWSKGEDFATSQSVASRVLGIPSSDSEKYLVNEDGSLVIYNVTLADGGRYHCRIVSENTNCRGAVSIEVTVNDFSFGIEQCELSESCSLQVEPSKETNLTCTAKGGPSSLSLKWFNDSKEITSVYSEHFLKEESITVSETITVPNEFGLPLTCKAIASEDGQACARLVHVRLQKTDTAKHQTDTDKSSAIWIVLLLLLIVETMFTIFLLIYIYVLTRLKGKDTQKKMQRKDQMEMLLHDEQTRFEETTEELEKVKNDLTEKETTLKTTTAELKKIKNDLTEKETTLTDTTAELEKAKNCLTEKETTLTDTTAELEKVKNCLTEKETTLTDTTAELEKVKNDLTEKETTLTDTTAELEKVKNDLTEKETTLTDTTAELEKVKNDLTEKETRLTYSSVQSGSMRRLGETSSLDSVYSSVQSGLMRRLGETSSLESVYSSVQSRSMRRFGETSSLESVEWSVQRRKPKRRSGETSSLESVRGSSPRNAEIEHAICIHNESEEQTYRRAVRFKSSKIITKDGGRIEIKGTGVSLLVPQGALLEDCQIHIQIITGNLDKGDDVTFASNSAAIVELTPNNLEFRTAVELNLPHCLQLEENFTNESMEVFTSHHHPKASPHWERETEVKFELQEESCKLYLKKFCWLTFRINNEIVEAKRLNIFTVGSKVMDTDSETTVHVGYFADVPGYEDIFTDDNITVGQYKPFWFKKEKPTPLVIFLKYLTPNEWKNTAEGSRKEISYEDIASSKNKSCAFVLRCITSVRRSGVPYATFRVYRQHDSTNITFRPKILDEFSEDEEP